MIADTLSRALQYEIAERPRIFNVSSLEDFPDANIEKVREATQRNPELQKLKTIITNGWADTSALESDLKKYDSIKRYLKSVDSDIVLKGEALYIPKSLRKDMLKRLHSAHLGYASMVRRARNKILWIGMNSEIKQLAMYCEACEERNPGNAKEPLRQHSDGIDHGIKSELTFSQLRIC